MPRQAHPGEERDSAAEAGSEALPGGVLRGECRQGRERVAADNRWPASLRPLMPASPHGPTRRRLIQHDLQVVEAERHARDRDPALAARVVAPSATSRLASGIAMPICWPRHAMQQQQVSSWRSCTAPKTGRGTRSSTHRAGAGAAVPGRGGGTRCGNWSRCTRCRSGWTRSCRRWRAVHRRSRLRAGMAPMR